MVEGTAKSDGQTGFLQLLAQSLRQVNLIKLQRTTKGFESKNNDSCNHSHSHSQGFFVSVGSSSLIYHKSYLPVLIH